LFFIDTKSVLSEKINPLLTADTTEELEKRPLTSSTALFSEVYLEINFL
jgi:hypothetical protein